MRFHISPKTLVMAFAAVTLSMSLYSCGDDDDNNNEKPVTPPEEQVAEENKLDSVNMYVTHSVSQDVLDLFKNIYLKGWKVLSNPYESSNGGNVVTTEEKTLKAHFPADRLPATVSARVQVWWKEITEVKSTYNLSYSFKYTIIAYYKDGREEVVTTMPYTNKYAWYEYNTTLYNPTLDILKKERDNIETDLYHGYSSFIKLNKKVENGKEVVTVYNCDEKQYVN